MQEVSYTDEMLELFSHIPYYGGAQQMTGTLMDLMNIDKVFNLPNQWNGYEFFGNVIRENENRAEKWSVIKNKATTKSRGLIFLKNISGNQHWRKGYIKRQQDS